MNVEDKTTMTMVPIGSMVIGLEGLNPAPGMDMDQEVFDKYPPRERDDAYHMAESWGLLNPGVNPYPCLTGAGQFNDSDMCNAARDRSRIAGMLLQEAQKTMRNYTEKQVDGPQRHV